MENSLNNSMEVIEDETQIFRSTIFFVIFLASTVCNLLALYVLKQRKVDRPSVKLTTALCVENLTTGGFLLILISLSSISQQWILGSDVGCYVGAILFITHVLSSSWIGLFISVDRYIAVKHSLRYSNWVSKKTCIFGVISIIMLSLGIAVVQISNHESIRYQIDLSICITELYPSSTLWKLYNLLIILMVTVLPLLSNCFIYSSIYRVTKNTTALARRNSFQPIATSESQHKDLDDVECVQASARQSIRKLSGQLIVHKDNRKAAKMGILVVLVEIVVFLPLFIIMFLSLLSYIESSSYHWLAVVCLFLDCLANPIVYVLRSKSARSVLSATCSPTKNSYSFNRHRGNTTQTSVFFRLIASQSSNESIQTIS